MIVHVSHPAPVRFARRGGRFGRLEFAALSTPVRLVDIEAGAMRVVHRSRTHPHLSETVYESEGRLWVRLNRERKVDGSWERRALPLDRFLGFLAGEEGPFSYSLQAFATRSPLQAWHAPSHNRILGWHGGERRGERIPDNARLAHDGQDLARDAARAYLEDGVRVCDGRVYVPFRGRHLAVWTRPPGQLQREPFEVLPVAAPEAFLATWRPDAFLVPADSPAAAKALARRVLDNGSYAVAVKLPPPEMEEIDLSATAGSGLVAHANEMPARVLRWLAAERPASMDGAVAAELASWEMRGSIGAVPAEDAAEVLALCVRAVRDAWDEAERMDPRHRVWALVDFTENVALPWLAARAEPVAEEDEAAFTGLAP